MEKIYGTNQAQNGIVHVGSKWIVFYGCYTDASGSTYEYRHTFSEKPTIEQVKEVVLAQIDANVSHSILTGLKWNGKPVWLSKENQVNFKLTYDLAVENEGKLPMQLKLGEDENGQPVYHTFNVISSFKDFVAKYTQHIIDCLSRGWKEKAAVDWSLYEA